MLCHLLDNVRISSIKYIMSLYNIIYIKIIILIILKKCIIYIYIYNHNYINILYF